MLLSQGRLRQAIFTVLLFFVVASGVFLYRANLYQRLPVPEGLKPQPSPLPKPTPVYKPKPELKPEITDNFPRAASAKSPSDLPEIPTWNKPPESHIEEKTPLFIGFTRNWRLLQQVVVSYMTAGWPPEDIYVVDNSGVMLSNQNGLLGLQNPFYLNYKRLTDVLGVKVLTAPTLLTFAQLQNFMTFTALERSWSHYFWAHMDSPAVSDEEYEEQGQPYKSLYMRAVTVMRETMNPGYGPLAARWFAYDRLTLVRTQAYVDVGGWDTLIPFYMGDCDMHERLWMRNFTIEDAKAGLVYDVASAMDDLEMFYRRGPRRTKREDAIPPPPPEPAAPVVKSDGRNSPEYHELLKELDRMQREKNEDQAGRNTWQARQQGGYGEPFYRDGAGFEEGISMMMNLGRDVFEAKWGRGRCDIREAGLGEDDAWRVVRDWEKEEVQRKAGEDRERELKERIKKEKDEQDKGNG
ncbi:MAG: hypothetical protein LQ338_001308 [Usnochroma carphineum]|nr:MAG: hypothetical protein LQ338_001308 [Usnochroma carphineum]